MKTKSNATIPIWKSNQDSSYFLYKGKFEGLSAGLRIRNKESQIYSWATANQDACRNEGKGNGKMFKLIDSRGAIYTVQYEFLSN